MGFATKNLNNTNQPTIQEPISDDKLNPQELALLLEMIKQTTFLGENVEIVYNTVVKLQKQFIEQTK